ncbi:TonB-dependent receptor [Fulvivirgaceae bacterium PWU5]|uniref:TonB-dependent receptor n=1 Tax=Dawidia cretensis TaxID=2782350 RepID=A0AAP2GUM3_9BACT|nr:TonB-dependent receptor [Dawidia cretensis]MBT1707727.1 TonB-dependent receptor [Dawidia cretensis]
MKISIVFLLCLVAHGAFAQISGTLSTPAGEPVAFATVLILHTTDSTMAKGAMTTESGTFGISGVAEGRYFVRYSAIGYQTFDTPPFTLTASAYDLGTQVLTEDAQTLGEVVVQGERPLFEQTFDRTIVNVQSSVLTQGSTALQVLERSPGVYVDGRNQSLSLNGKSNVLVMLNGKPMRLPGAQVMALLNGMNGGDIEKIELLTTPPAQYDADGSGGMINIVLKKQEETGTTGSVSATAGYGWGKKGNISASLSHRTARMTTYGSYAFAHDRRQDGWAAVSTQNMPAFGGKLLVDVSSTEQATANNHTAIAGVDINLTRGKVGGSITHNSSRIARHIANPGIYTLLESDSLLGLDSHIDGKNRWNNTIANLYMERTLRDGEQVNVDLDYLYYDQNSPTHGRTTFYGRAGNEAVPPGSIFSDQQRGTSQTPIHVGVVKADYTRALGKDARLETGIKGTLTRTTSLARIETLVDGVWTTNARYRNDVDMVERIGAVYSSLNWQATSDLNLVAGLRYEYSYTHANADKEENTIHRTLGKLFPSVFVSRKLTEDATLQFSYTKRIGRPSYNDLTSYLQYGDPMSVSTGNPSLKPTVTHNLKAGLMLSDYAFSLTASRDDHPIIYYQQKESPAGDLMYLAPQNMAYQNSLMLQATLPFTITSFWTMNYSLNGGLRQFKLDHTREKLQKTYVAYSLNGNQTFLLPWNLSLEVSGWYNSLQYEGSKKVQGFGVLSAGIKKELKGNGGSFQLTVNDIFQSMKVRGAFGTLVEEAFSLQANYVYRGESARARIVKISYTRVFGNVKLGQRSRTAVSKDERERIRKE